MKIGSVNFRANRQAASEPEVLSALHGAGKARHPLTGEYPNPPGAGGRGRVRAAEVGSEWI
jgi:hypothetical protein